MANVQLIVQKDNFARDLAALLSREGDYQVVRTDKPDWAQDGAIVADHVALQQYPALLHHPDRLVLIIPNDRNLLALLWEHNVRWVVFDTDPPSTAVLAILGSGLGQRQYEPPKPKPRLVVLNSRNHAHNGCANMR